MNMIHISYIYIIRISYLADVMKKAWPTQGGKKKIKKEIAVLNIIMSEIDCE